MITFCVCYKIDFAIGFAFCFLAWIVVYYLYVISSTFQFSSTDSAYIDLILLALESAVYCKLIVVAVGFKCKR